MIKYVLNFFKNINFFSNPRIGVKSDADHQSTYSKRQKRQGKTK